jgi:hypothetical protein
MFRARWLGSFLETDSSRKDRRRLAARKRKPIRLMLESLEERLTPSGGQTAGSYSALTAAVAADTAANTNYVIQITGNFTFNSGGQVSISKLGSGSALTIEGQSGTNYTLTGNGNRLFDIASGQNVTFADLSLTGGSVTNNKGNAQGGAILDEGGNVTLSEVIVQGNTVKGSAAEGGGVFASGAGILAIHDSTLSDNSALGSQGATGTAPGMNGSAGGSAYGGGLYVAGSGWTVALTGDALSDNAAIGGNGGTGAAGSNATAPNTRGSNGGAGGDGGNAEGVAAYFSVSSGGSGRLTILNNLTTPLTDPSTMIDNSAQAGSGGNGGSGGDSTGLVLDAFGGGYGSSGYAEGGALYVSNATGATFNVNIGNSTFYANKAVSGNYGAIGALGTGGIVPPPPPSAFSPPAPAPYAPFAAGGGLALGDGNITIVNSTVAKNTAINTAVAQYFGGAAPPAGYNLPGPGLGGGIYDNDAATLVLDNNTITQNTVSRGNFYATPSTATGAGVYVASGNPTLVNNVIQGNQNSDASASDLTTNGNTLSNSSNNFIGNTQMQLGSVVGVDANGKATGGPIYYPLVPGVASIGAGSSSVVNTIAAVEGTTPANAVDEIGNPLFHNGTIDLGAVQTVTTPPSLSPFQLIEAIILDTDAFLLQDFPPALSFLNSISEQALGLPLPATADLIPIIESDFAALVDMLAGTIEGDIAALVNILRGNL